MIRCRISPMTVRDFPWQLVLSFVFLLLWGLIAQSTAMIGVGLAGTAVAWILVKPSALRDVSTKVEEKELSMR